MTGGKLRNATLSAMWEQMTPDVFASFKVL